MKKNKILFFKNDPFGIKHEIFLFRAKHLVRKKTELKVKKIALCLKAINDMNVPKNESEELFLKRVLEVYDKTLAEIEDETLSYARSLFAEKKTGRMQD